MALRAILQLTLFASFLVTCSCIAGTNDLEGLAQGGDGQLVSYLLLRMVSGLETDMQELRNQMADMQELKARAEDIQELKAKVEVDGGYIEELKAQNADDGRKIEELKAEITELKSMNRGM